MMKPKTSQRIRITGVGLITLAITGMVIYLIADIDALWMLPIAGLLLVGTCMIETKETSTWKAKYLPQNRN